MIASLPLAPHTAYRRSELQAMYEKFKAEIEKLNQRVEEQACGRPGARLLMTHLGVGPSQRWRPRYSWAIQHDSPTARPWLVM